MVVLVFLGQPLPGRRAYEDRIIDFANDYKGKSVKVVGVAVADLDDDTPPGDQGLHQGEGHRTTSTATTRRQAIGKAYGATNTPQFFVLDKDRKIRYIGRDGRQPEGRARSRRPTSATRSTPSSRARPSRSTETRPTAAASPTPRSDRRQPSVTTPAARCRSLGWGCRIPTAPEPSLRRRSASFPGDHAPDRSRSCRLAPIPP